MMDLVRQDCEMGGNMDKNAINVEWAKLKQTSVHTTYKSECPVCYSGMLLVCRNKETFELEARDRCLFCGQMFVYTDIEDMRAIDHGKMSFPQREMEAQE